ncbi:MAG: restriction endonuclease subunit S [Chloroflexota bacterium]
MGLSPGFKQTEAGMIPEAWDLVLLDSVARRGSGHTPDKAHPEYWGGTIKWISLQDSNRLDRLYISDTTAKITPAGIANSSARLHAAGTVVMSRDAGVGKSAIMQEDMAVSQHFMAWTCGPLLSNHYLYYWLQSQKSELGRIAMGNTIKTIGLPFFKRLSIPLPTLAEQEAIAGALSDADALIESLEQLIAKKRHIKHGAMQELLTGKTRLPGFSGEWEVKRLGQILSLRYGSSQRGKAASGGQFPILATSGEVGRTNVSLYDKPSIILGRKGTIDKPQFVQTPFWAIDTAYYCEIGPMAIPKFLYYKLTTLDWRSFNEASGVPSLSATTVEAIEIALPPAPEQSSIADIDAEIAALEAKLDKARQIKQGMMQELLTGRARLV